MTAGIGLGDNSTVDTSKLTAAIKVANTKAGAAVAGIEMGQYPQSAINTFNKAIATAQAVADDKTATQAEVNKAVTNLQAAGKTFDAAKITTINKAALTAVITAANSKVKNAVDGTEVGQYPQSAIDAFNAAIATAQAVANYNAATQAEVNQAITNLQAAEKTFDAAKMTNGGIRLLPSVTNLKKTATGPTWINWTWVNPTDVNFSHVMVYMNGSFITDTSERSTNYYNATGLSDGTTYTISIRTVAISGNIGSIWVNDSASTVKLPGIYNLSAVNITDSSITLMWEASNDTKLVEILRDDIIISNTSGSASYVDSNLSSGTTYSYTLVPYNNDRLEGKAVSIKLDTVSSQREVSGAGGSTTSKKSTGGSGGGGGSSEDFANIALKDADSEYLRADANVTYEFTKPGNDILSVGFYSLKNSGEVTSTIEVLKERSKLVNSSPEGLVYEYINIWVGKAGFATSDNIDDARFRFKVNNSWIQEVGITPADVRLQRYNGTEWEVLPTELVSDTMDYIVFESQVPGFSSFAITAEKSFASPTDNDTDTEPAQAEVADIEQAQPKETGIWTFVKVILVVEVFALGFEYWRRKKK